VEVAKVTHWCAALTIDSLQANFDFSVLNGNCVEPVNFGFLTHTGKPVAPPGPDQITRRTFIPTRNVLAIKVGIELTTDDFIVSHVFPVIESSVFQVNRRLVCVRNKCIGLPGNVLNGIVPLVSPECER
jgi:hypothetical protein